MLKSIVYKTTLFKRQKYVLSKGINLVKLSLSQVISKLLNKPIIWGYPMIVKVESSSFCNLKCPLCYLQRFDVKAGNMNIKLLKNIVDKVKKKSILLVLNNRGEPLICKEIIKMIAFATQNGMITNLSTNLNFDIDFEALVKSGLKKMIVSIDGLSQETYEKYRVGGNLNVVLSNIKKISNIKKKLNTPFPIISWRYIYFSHNENEAKEQIIKKAKEVGCNELKLCKPHIIDKSDKNYLRKGETFSNYLSNGELNIKKKIKGCKYIWQEMVIDWDGSVDLCCLDSAFTKVGDIKDGLLKVWNGKTYNKLRALILKNRDNINECKTCFRELDWEEKLLL